MHSKYSQPLFFILLAWIAFGVASMYVPPHVFWPAGFVAMSLPFALLLNLAFLVYWLARRSWRTLLPLGVLLLLSGLYQRGLRVPLGTGSDNKGGTELQVLSYNVRVFNVYRHLHSDDRHEVDQLLGFVKDHPAGVICLQEFFNNKTPRELQSTPQLLKTRPHHYVSVALENNWGNEFGLAIFSRYPILKHGTIWFGEKSANHAMYADIKLANDTVRVYNFHLQSMSIEDKHLPDANDNRTQLRHKGSNLFVRLKRGLIKRSRQVQQLRDHIEQSPYPVIATGDLNDLPYSYTYQHLSQILQNAYQEAGRGISATYAGRLPMLRIDNQFCSPQLEPVQYQTLSEVEFTDHYPTLGKYRIKKKL